MQPSFETSTAVLPWYERDDFPLFWAMAEDRDGIAPCYATWERAATTLLSQGLAAGRAIQVVTIRPAPFLAWLGDRPNTTENRLLYAEKLAVDAIVNRVNA